MGVEIREVATNHFTFRFLYDKDTEQVLNMRPWNFNKQLVVTLKLHGDMNPKSTNLTMYQFWVQVINLPLGLYSEKDCWEQYWFFHDLICRGRKQV